ncbi:MAG: hypothetical protein K0R38_6268 [Polyangiaceae bacterium]|nr:hypothetical protein [Polyangiaceae bacterium]
MARRGGSESSIERHDEHGSPRRAQDTLRVGAEQGVFQPVVPAGRHHDEAHVQVARGFLDGRLQRAPPGTSHTRTPGGSFRGGRRVEPS